MNSKLCSSIKRESVFCKYCGELTFNTVIGQCDDGELFTVLPGGVGKHDG